MSPPNSLIVDKVAKEFIAFGVEGVVVIDHSTSYPMATKELYMKFEAQKRSFIDALLLGDPDEASYEYFGLNPYNE